MVLLLKLRDLRRSHDEGHKPNLVVHRCLLDLTELYFLVSHAGLSGSESLQCNESLIGCEKPGIEGRVWDCETPDAKDKSQSAGKDIDVLPWLKTASRDLREAVVQGTADNCEPAGSGEPPALPEGLLGLRVVTADGDHEGRRNDGLREPFTSMSAKDSFNTVFLSFQCFEYLEKTAEREVPATL